MSQIPTKAIEVTAARLAPGSPLYESDDVPFFPFQCSPDKQNYLVVNPLTQQTYELNQAAYQVLKLCDGYRTWYEIVHELSQAYAVDYMDTKRSAESFLSNYGQSGLIWWRKHRMQWIKTPPPFAVLWDLTARCNLKCRHCVVSSGPERSEQLSLSQTKNLIDEMSDFGVQLLILSGGEPLARKDFFEILEYAMSKGFQAQLATNATLITSKKALKLSQFGIHAQVSLDALTPAIHDKFRGKSGAWNKTVAGIKNLLNVKIPVSVAAVATKANAAEIPALYHFAADLGVNSFRVMPFVPYGRGEAARDLELEPENMRQLTVQLDQLRNKIGLPIVPMEFECTLHEPDFQQYESSKHIGCDGGIAYCTVTSSGDVLPCNYFAGVETDNIKDKSFAWIWENSRILNYFRSLATDDIHGACQSCNWLNQCRGSCIAANFSHGDIFQSNCHCWVAAEQKPNRFR